MFREMRRKKQLLPAELTEAVMKSGITGVLGVLGDEGYPYTVPVNYVYEQRVIYFHCAKAGHKLDAIRREPKVSFSVIHQEEIVPEAFTAYFSSAIAFGRAAEVTDDEEKRRAMRMLNKKYAPGRNEAGEEEIQKFWTSLCVVKIEVEHLTGKEAIELAKMRLGQSGERRQG